MKIIFPICSSSNNEKYEVVIEVICTEEPEIKVDDHFVGISPILDFNFIEEQSSPNWRDRFLVGPSPYKGISIYGRFPDDRFCLKLPKIISEE